MAALQAKPRFHIAPSQGWINDPNGPLFYGGLYHMFYQYVERGCSWAWGLLWGHAVSRDLVSWQHLPPALAPTFGGFDGDGCFSGCATVDEDGVPIILYTGVRLRSSELCGPLPPPECDLGTACIESQCLAVGDPDDPKLVHWVKEEAPFLALPPPNLALTAWRDPYVIGRPGQGGQDGWTVMVGAGVKGKGGTALVYKADSLRSGSWSYVGELCCGEGDTGLIWECPVMLQLPRLPPPAKPLPGPAAPLATRRTPSSPASFAITASAGLLSPCAPPDSVSTSGSARPLQLPQSGGSMPGSPHPSMRLLGLGTAGGAGEVSEAGAGEGPWAGAAYGDRALAAVLSPRRPCGLPGPMPLQLRLPPRWQLPPLHGLPHAPSPPMPRPPSTRRLATATSPLSPSSHAGGAARQPQLQLTPTRLQRRQHAAAPSVAASQSLPALQLLSAGSKELPPPPAPHTPLPATAAEAAKLAPWHRGHPTPPSPSPSWQRYQTFFCVCPDDCNSMAVYYLGAFDPTTATFDLGSALGPFVLDLGDVFYAANTLVDPQGRVVLWGWVQEKPRKVGAYDYAGCLSLPRLLFLEVDEGRSPASYHLVQRPPPELAALRVPGSEWVAEGLLLDSGATASVPLPASAAHHLELELAVRVEGAVTGPPAVCPLPGVEAEGSAVTFACACNSCSGVLLHSWSGGPEGAAALLYHWDSGVLEVVFEAMDPTTLTFSLAAPGARRVGGPLLRPPAPGSPLELRVFLDYSCLEVFTAGGEVLTARVYRGSGPAPGGAQRAGEAGAGVELVSFGCCSEFSRVAAYEVGGIWVDEV